MAVIRETTDAPSASPTGYSLTAGDFFFGSLTKALDPADVVEVTLEAGNTYTFAMVGTDAGPGSAIDTMLALTDASGTTVASDDNGGPGNFSSITISARASATYYLQMSQQDGSSVAGGQKNYGVSMTVGTKADFDVEMGAGALLRWAASWASAAGTAATVSWGIRQSGVATDAQGVSVPFEGLTAGQIAAAANIMDLAEGISGLTLNQVNPGGTTNEASILYGSYTSSTDGAGAYAYGPGNTASGSVSGDIWLNNQHVSGTDLPFGSYSYFTILHELGHALGLPHPGDYNAAPGVVITYADFAQFTQDTHQYTVMSYFDESNTTAPVFEYPETFMLYDIFALQKLYGADYSFMAGDTVYGFNSNAGGPFDFSTNSDPLLCIWDGSGFDTLDVSGFSMDQLVDLRDGKFSDIGGFVGNVSIAVGAMIEAAVGGGGNDTIIGNDLANTLGGGLGADTLTGGGGVDLFRGTLGEIDGDTIQDYEAGERIVIVGALLQLADIFVAGSSSLVSIDENNDGLVDATFTLNAGFALSDLSLVQVSGGSTALIFGEPPLPTSPKEDLTIADVSFASNVIVVGGTAEVSYLVENIGDDDAPDTGLVGFWVSPDAIFGNGNETLLETVAYGGVNALTSGPLKTEVLEGVSTLGVGTFYLFVKADNFDTRDESNEFNNVSEVIGFTVQDTLPPPVPVPDIAMRKPVLSATAYRAGDSLSLVWNVTNVGGADAVDGNVIAFYLSVDQAIDGADTLLGGASFDALLAGEVDTHTLGGLSIPAGLAPGVYHVIATTDPVTGETNATNNTAFAEFTIPGPPGVPTEFDDTLSGTVLADTISLLAGRDHYFAGSGNDTANGDGGDDVIFGQIGDDHIDGGTGNDRVFGGQGMDLILGGDGNDSLHGEAGADRMFGNSGEDLMRGGWMSDWLYGGADNDILMGEGGNDHLFGGLGNDIMLGGDGNDTIFGAGNNDFLGGGKGSDVLFGEDGNDFLSGETGNDTLTGGNDSDRFIFRDGFGLDVITDFDVKEALDQVDLRNVAAITDVADLFNNHLFQVGNDVEIRDLLGNVITMSDVSQTDLLNADFFLF